MHKRTGLAAMALTAGILLVNGPSATASTQLSTSCAAGVYDLSASVWYTTPNATYHHWTGSSFRVHNPYNRNENNVDFWLYQGPTMITHRGADNIAANFTYSSSTYSEFALNEDTLRSQNEHVGFIAVFDRFNAPDPDCQAVTPNI
jgi:hypothetical protein